MSDVKVLIVGAGPTGLALALWLTELGIRTRIIDKSSGPGETSRAMAVQARTLEFYRQLGFAERLIEDGSPNPIIHLWIERQRRARLSLAHAGAEETPYPYLLVYPQDRHERVLIEQLKARGIEVERETELLGLVDLGEAVEARLRLPSGEEAQVMSHYLVGCDGASSFVRKAIGAGFPGETGSQFFYVADVDFSGPAADGNVHIALDHGDFLALESYGTSGTARLIGIMRDEDGVDVTALTFKDVSPRVLEGLDVRIDAVHWFSTYRVHHRVADQYRSNRVFLAGDAAHVHSPAGGQGMNTGIGDAVNLAWKLAEVLDGRAPETLLDTYEVERRAFAEELVATTDRVFGFVTSSGALANFVRTKIAPIVAPVAYSVGVVREFLFRVLSQIKIAYEASPLSQGTAGSVTAGERMPWVRGLAGDNFRYMNGVDWQLQIYGEAGEQLSDWAAARDIAVHAFDWTPRCVEAGIHRGGIYLLRPDGHVAYAADAFNPDDLSAYLLNQGLDISRRHRVAMGT